MAQSALVQAGAFAQQIADLIGLDNWQLQEASYNGAQFHWMTPAYNGINPAAAITQYIQNDLSNVPVKPAYGTWSNVLSMQDSVEKKLVTYSIPNMDGYYIEDFGLTGTTIDVTGIVYGPQYLTILDNCSRAFLDSEVSIGSAASNSGQPIGVQSKTAFRKLVHVIYGEIDNVYLRDFTILTASDKFQAAAFKLSLIASDPSYLSSATAPSTWQSEAQEILEYAEGIIAAITQSFSLGQSLASYLFSNSISSPKVVQIPVINGTGQYLQSVMKAITDQLINISNTYANTMAFLAQNNGGVISNSFWNSIQIDYTLLPVYLAPYQAFSQSDAQVIITAFESLVNNFLSYASDHVYTYNLQDNIFAMAKGVSQLNNFAQVILSQNSTAIEVNLLKTTDLYSVMSTNGISFDNFNRENTINAGSWYTCLMIPSGVVVTL